MRILAVDDDEAVVRFLAQALRPEHEVCPCVCGAEALGRLGQGRLDLLLTDLDMPSPDGFELLRAAQRSAPPVPVIVLTGMDTARAALEALRLGARDYLVKPVHPESVREAVGRVADTFVTGSESAPIAGLVGRSAALRATLRMVPMLSGMRESVLITGETGVGKELLARALHELGPRSSRPFVAHNMAATPADLAEALFFGYVRGAFSGAVGDHPGLFEQAEGGTLFLDEIDSFPLPLQAKLLRLLESARARRLGATQDQAVDVRVVAASAVELSALVARGQFRADLYYRLRQVELTLPPLRERLEDVPLLTRHFLDALARQTGRATVFSPAALEALCAHTWPGNVRELRHAVRSAALMAGEGPVLPGHLPRAILSGPGGGPPEPHASLRALEREHVLRALGQTGGNRSKAARLLGIDRGTLARKLRDPGSGER